MTSVGGFSPREGGFCGNLQNWASAGYPQSSSCFSFEFKFII